jgi:hypothetical protein
MAKTGFNVLEGEIAEGKLHLKADSLVRFRFTFAVGPEPIGCYAIRSVEPYGLRFERAWNVGGQSYDPRKGMYVPSVVSRKLDKVRVGAVMRVCVLAPERDEILDYATFKAARVEFNDGPDVAQGAGKAPLKFECVDVLGISFVEAP